MPTEDAIVAVRHAREVSIEIDRQEGFLRDFQGEIWRRSTGVLVTANASLGEGNTSAGSVKLTGSLQGQKPSLIVMCGLPGSGKSYLAKEIAAATGGLYLVASQDEIGSRGGIEDVVGRACKGSGSKFVIVDRCNLQVKDRTSWYEVAFRPTTAVIIHMDIEPSVCISRAESRVDHPTLVPGKARRLIQSLQRSIETPGPSDLKKGFSAICTVQGAVDVQEVLSSLIIASAKSSCSMADASSSVAHIENESFGQTFSGLVKFPRTRHLLNMGAATRDDLLFDEKDTLNLLSLCRNGRWKLTVEEKVDGANLGFSIDPSTGCLRVQNRSHYVDEHSHAQFKPVRRFIEKYGEDLWLVLGRSEKMVLYGEWLFARHSIKYERLPSLFLAFDLYDGQTGQFYSRRRFREIMNKTRLSYAREIEVDVENCGLEELRRLVRETNSAYCDGLIEGIYVRADEGDWLRMRGKVVRSDFIAGNEHWSRRDVERNGVKDQYEWF